MTLLHLVTIGLQSQIMIRPFPRHELCIEIDKPTVSVHRTDV
jgi:hypothetical protein